MRLLTLNMNMFNYQFDNSFYDYIDKINPDLTIIQEARFNRLCDKNYPIIYPKGYDQSTIDSRIHLTIALSKKDWIRDNDVDFGRCNYSHIGLKNNNLTLLGVHTPNIEDNIKMDCFFKKYNTDIVCGDFNASSKKKESLNYKLYQQLINNGYCNLWEKGLSNNMAYYYNYEGIKLKADKSKFFRTYSGNTHIDYVLAKNTIKINEVAIDYRTLAFTDHCSIIVDIEKIND